MKNGYLPIFFLITVSIAVSLRLVYLPLLLSFKVTDYSQKLVVSNNSLSLKAPAISVDQKQHVELFCKTGILIIFNKIRNQRHFSILHYSLYFKNELLGMYLSDFVTNLCKL